MLHLTAGVSAAMNDRSLNTNVKIDTLTFLSGALCTHTPEVTLFVIHRFG